MDSKSTKTTVGLRGGGGGGEGENEKQRRKKPIEQRIEFNMSPLDEINASPADKIAIQNVAQMMISVHYPQHSILNFFVEEETEKWIVVVCYPKYVSFSLRDLSLIAQVNEYLVGEVLVCPRDNKVDFIAEVYKTEYARKWVVPEQILTIVSRSRTRRTKRKMVEIEGDGPTPGEGSE